MGFWVGAGFVFIILLQAYYANLDRMLFPIQMVQRGYLHGFPLIANGGMWGNLFIMPWVLGFIVAQCASQWSVGLVVRCAFIGIFASAEMTRLVYLRGKFPDSLSGPNGLSVAGALNVMYMAGALTIIELFIVSDVLPQTIFIVGSLLLLYVAIANHVPLKIMRDIYHFPWCPDVFEEEASPLRILAITQFVIVVGVVLKWKFPGHISSLF